MNLGVEVKLISPFGDFIYVSGMQPASKQPVTTMEMEEKQIQNQPKPKTEKEEEDRISLLPDCLLHEFISRLPSTKEAIKTGTLSKRWQHLWTQVHNLIFVHNGPNHLLSDFFSYVDKTLTQCRHLNLNKFELMTDYCTDFEARVNDCIRYAVNCNVQHLCLWNTNDEMGFEFELHSDFFFADPCFSTLLLTGFKLNPAGSISWNKLTKLSILEGNFDEHVFQNILSGSPLLETLLIRNCYGFERIDITSKSVKNFVFYGYVSPGEDLEELDDIIEINAPYIVSLEIKDVFYLSRLSLLNVSSLVQARLDYTNGETEEMPVLEYEAEMLEGLILSLRHVKELKIGYILIEVLSSLEAEGFIFPSHMKIVDADSRLYSYSDYMESHDWSNSDSDESENSGELLDDDPTSEGDEPN